MARKSRTPMVVLGILGMLRKPLSGYDIKRVIDNSVSHFWAESFGQIYPVLKLLTAEKLIQAQAAQETSRKRILYSITPKGAKQLKAWLAEAPEPERPREELILKIFFGSESDIPHLIGHLQERRSRANAAGEQYTQWLKIARKQNESYTPFQIMTLRAGVIMSRAFVQWADQSLLTLNQMRKSTR